MELNLSALWIIFFVLVLTYAVNRLLIKPLTNTMNARKHAIDSARALAERAAAEARTATEEFERKMGEARADVYRQMDEMRRVAGEERTRLLDETRADAASTLADAKARLQTDFERARTELRRDAQQLGDEAARRILGRTS